MGNTSRACGLRGIVFSPVEAWTELLFFHLDVTDEIVFVPSLIYFFIQQFLLLLLKQQQQKKLQQW